MAVQLSSRVIDEVLGIQSFTGGLLLGVFFLSLGQTRGSLAPTTGIVVGLAVLLAFRLFTVVSWQWHVLIGSAVTFMASWLVGSLADRAAGIRHV